MAERRKLLRYLQKENEEAFKELAQKLKLKIAKKMIAEEEEKKRLEEEARKKEEEALLAKEAEE